MQHDQAEVDPAGHGRIKIYERPGPLATRSRVPLVLAVSIASVALALWWVLTCTV